MVAKPLNTLVLILAFFASGAQGSITHINLWEQTPPEIAHEIDKWIKVFAVKHPNIRIIRQHYETEELRTKFMRSALTNDGADLVIGPNDMAGIFVAAEIIQPVDDIIVKDQFSETSTGIVTLKNKIWGIPISEGNHLMLYYNKNLVPDAPKSFTEIIAFGMKFTDPQKNRFGLAMYQSEPYWFVPILGGFGGWPLHYGRDGSVSVSIDTEPMTKALSFLRDLKFKHKILPKDCNVDCAKSMFLKGNAPYHINGDWDFGALHNKLGQALGVAPLPEVPETGSRATPMLSGLFMFHGKAKTEEKEMAKRLFSEFITTPMVQKRVATKIGKIPALKVVRNDPEIQKIKTVRSIINAAQFAKPAPADLEMRAAWNGMRIMVQRTLSGKESPKAAVKTGQRAADEALHNIASTKAH